METIIFPGVCGDRFLYSPLASNKCRESGGLSASERRLRKVICKKRDLCFLRLRGLLCSHKILQPCRYSDMHFEHQDKSCFSYAKIGDKQKMRSDPPKAEPRQTQCP